VVQLAGNLAAQVRRNAFTFAFQASEAGVWRALVYVVSSSKPNSSARKKSVLIGSGKAATTEPGKAKLKIKLNNKGRALFRRKRGASAVLRLSGQDTAGNASRSVTRKIKLKKRP
jgi:hypothetical protein